MADPATETIGAAQLANLRAAGALLDTLAGDSTKWPNRAAQLEFLRAAKKIAPAIRVPEDDIAAPLLEPINAQLAALKEQNRLLEERESARALAAQNAEAESELQKLLGRVQKKRNLNEKGVELVIERMKKTGSMDADAAALAVIEENYVPDPIGAGHMAPGAVDVFHYNSGDEASIKALHANPEKWFDDQVAQMIDEFRRGEAA